MTFLEKLKNTKGFMRGILVFFAALLTLGGPTYFMFILNEASLPRVLILAAGIISLVIGLLLFSFILQDEQQSS
jgi:hypothetical protein